MAISWVELSASSESSDLLVLTRRVLIGPVSGGYLLRVDLDGLYRGWMPIPKSASVYVPAAVPDDIIWTEQSSDQSANNDEEFPPNSWKLQTKAFSGVPVDNALNPIGTAVFYLIERRVYVNDVIVSGELTLTLKP